jgi:tetratricopeptide (TPR) repeat protein
MQREFFRHTGQGALAFAVFAVGFLSLAPLLLQRPDVWEVPIACAHAAWMLTLLLVWRVLAGGPGLRWSAVLAGVCAAIGVGSRPAGLLCAAILLLPTLRLFRAGGDAPRLVKLRSAALVFIPLGIVGASLLAFNYARFGNALEFGQKYQLNADLVRTEGANCFKLTFFPYNLDLYFLNVRGLRPHFPFIADLETPPAPPGQGGGDSTVGIIGNIPAIVFSLAPFLVRRRLREPQRRTFTLAAATIAGLAVAGAAPLMFFFGACIRYQFEFVPAIAVLAGLGLLCVEEFYSGWPRRLLRGAGGVAVAASAAFCLLSTISERVINLTAHGLVSASAGEKSEAEVYLRRAVILEPTMPIAWGALGRLHARAKDYQAAADDYARAIVGAPDWPVLYANYGYCLLKLGRQREAVAALSRALALNPDLGTIDDLLEHARDLDPTKAPLRPPQSPPR